jgi:hypothetical protein
LLDIALVLENDYFSYARERSLHDQQKRHGILFNDVAVLMVQHSIPEEKALAQLKHKILEADKQHTLELERYVQERSLSKNYRSTL